MSPGLVSSAGHEGSNSRSFSLACRWLCFPYVFISPSLLCICVQIFSFYKDTRHIRLGLTLITYFNLITFVKTLPPNIITF